jgi:hypothetical protein
MAKNVSEGKRQPILAVFIADPPSVSVITRTPL